jgi:hydrogenase maturation protein HypF
MVQGVGFRPHVYRLARKLKLNGFVINTSQGVTIELEGNSTVIKKFVLGLDNGLPPHACIHSKQVVPLELQLDKDFEIRQSDNSGETIPLVLPDIAVCPECLNEMFDPFDRRYLYPFINCTHCGPRFSIIDSLPYDRPNTSMAGFRMCADCRAEYEDPINRRFHAQPIACPVCGPEVEFHEWPFSPSPLKGEEAFKVAIKSLQRGWILALKGLGGFQLLVDATNRKAIRRLRDRKQRGNKPFAIMFPDFLSAKKATDISELEQELILSDEAPIVLVKKRDDRFNEASPDNPNLGIFLPYTPLHHILLKLFQKPIIATSGNLAEEPICIDNQEAFNRLSKVADTFLVHNRPIRRPVDDSVVHVVAGQAQIIRRARGYAPLPIRINKKMSSTLAVGGHLKNTIAIGKGQQIICSQHIGNLDTTESVRAFKSAIKDFKKLYEIKNETVVSDKHPDYLSSQIARDLQGTSKIQVQHHLAHVFACMADHELSPPLLGISWDGTGYGNDGSIWGAESFLLTEEQSQRVASIFPIRLPGGENAIRETHRIATSLLHASHCRLSVASEAGGWFQLILKGINAPICSSMGRLFDGISSLLGLCRLVDYEGEAAMLLETEAAKSKTSEIYPYLLLKPNESGPVIFDWRPLVRGVVNDLKTHSSKQDIARKFHNTLVDYILEIAKHSMEERVLLTGGCFQNKLLSEMTIEKLSASGFAPFINRNIPPNDGGLAAGQIYGTLFPENIQLT